MSVAPGSRKLQQTKQLRDNLRGLTSGFREWVEDALRPEGMTVPQIRLLYAVQQDPEASSAAIARQCQVTPQTLQSMMQRAVRERWLVRRPAPHNAHTRMSALTPRGEAMLGHALSAVEDFERRVWHGVSVAELQRMNELLGEALVRMRQQAVPLTKRASVAGAGSASVPQRRTAVPQRTAKTRTTRSRPAA